MQEGLERILTSVKVRTVSTFSETNARQHMYKLLRKKLLCCLWLLISNTKHIYYESFLYIPQFHIEVDE